MADSRWVQLLNPTRARDSSHDPVDHRSEFERDFDRVVFSSSFRRLQDKTQVWPLESHDFVRTRLTHSCEVAAVGRSLVKGVFGEVTELQEGSPDAVHGAATIVSTACLLHDIGNPPFGHTGEQHIADWFADLLETETDLELDHQEMLDLKEFEGNAHALRVATCRQTLGSPHGMNLTYATLSALMKYPWASMDAPHKAGKKRKFGVFKSEMDLFYRAREATGLTGTMRHPLAHLVEAADDIAYSVVDVEDGLKKGAFAYRDFIDAAKNFGDKVSKFVEPNLCERLNYLQSSHAGCRQSELEQLAFQYFRVFAVGRAIASVVKTFRSRYEDIMQGGIRGDLLDLSDSKELIQFLKDFAQTNVYGAPEVLKTERAAKAIVRGLLDILWDETRVRRGGKRSKLLESLLRNAIVDERKGSSDYQICQDLADYVAGMTDTFAQALYTRLSGVRQ